MITGGCIAYTQEFDHGWCVLIDSDYRDGWVADENAFGTEGFYCLRTEMPTIAWTMHYIDENLNVCYPVDVYDTACDKLAEALETDGENSYIPGPCPSTYKKVYCDPAIKSGLNNVALFSAALLSMYCPDSDSIHFAYGYACELAPPSSSPTFSEPTNLPTQRPSKSPSTAPTNGPTVAPSKSPSKAPTNGPTPSPTSQPTVDPTVAPSKSPSKAPTQGPTPSPTSHPTDAPTQAPSRSPSDSPSNSPTTDSPSRTPSASPSVSPTTSSPSSSPTAGDFILKVQGYVGDPQDFIDWDMANQDQPRMNAYQFDFVRQLKRARKGSEERVVELCQSKSTSLTCPEGSDVAIISASVRCCNSHHVYNDACPLGDASTCATKDDTSKSQDRTSWAKNHCDGKKACTVGLWTGKAEDRMSDKDVCFGYSKMAMVTYKCVSSQRKL